MPDFAKRRDKLRRLVRKTDADAILITSELNVTYLTGFTGDSSYLLLTNAGDELIISDMRYGTHIETECPGLEMSIRGPGVKMLEALPKIVKSAKVSSLAVETAAMTVAFHEEFTKALSDVKLVPTTGLVEQLREVKDKGEIAEIREAVAIAEKAFAVVIASLRPEQTEKELLDAVEAQVRLFGGECTAFWPIVGVGSSAAMGHYRPGRERRVADADFVLFDWGAKANLYLSDLTRVVVTGKLTSKFEKIYNTVLAANRAAIKAIRPGAIMQDIDGVARKVIEKAGYGKKFGHSLGHGFGLQIHEGPWLRMKEDRPLQAGMVVTVEPGIYIPGWGGVRIEDDILVTRDGHEELSIVAKDLGECVVV
ncbi:MAG: aminopeptidase [Planctomycetaceae bacterium]|nr:aminopeptidase [Planctomycetaceae bacterium]